MLNVRLPRKGHLLTFAAVLSAFTVTAAQFKFPNQTLTVPDGFEVELVAAGPLVDRPVSGALDEQGRFFVTDSSGSNDKPDKQLQDKPHRVMLLEDSKGNGHFDKSTIFADHMMFPEGCMWYEGSLYVSAPPSIWKLTDTNHDGVADVRVEWHQGKTLTGCANDLHGPYLGPDGWIYWCKGAFAEQTYDRPGRVPFVSKAAHIFRARPNGTGIEPVMTGGMDNPVGVAFTAGGERILCGTFFVHPAPGQRDGLIHAVYGGVYGKPNNVTDDHRKTGDLMPVMTHMGAAAPCSVIRYESAVLGPELKDNLFVCSFNLRKVSRHILQPDGATFKTTDSDFVTSDSADFHPTDVIEDADGSLLVIDTGGWYKICCPTSQLSKPDLLGAIYRIRKVGAKKVTDPRGLKLAWAKMNADSLARLLGDPRPAVVKRAMHDLAAIGAKAVSSVATVEKRNSSPEARRNAVWTLTRIDSPAARAAVRTALDDADANVRQAALHSVSLWRDATAIEKTVNILRTDDPQHQRVAAEALGRIGDDVTDAKIVGTGSGGSVPEAVKRPADKSAMAALLDLSAAKHDRILEHSLTYALIEIADAKATYSGLVSRKPLEERAALIALDQIDDSRLRPQDVTPFLNSSEPELRNAALWVAGHHPDWGDEMAGYFGARLESAKADGPGEELSGELAQFISSKSIQDLLGEKLADAQASAACRQIVLRSIARASVGNSVPSWTSGVKNLLAQGDGQLLPASIQAAKNLAVVKNSPPNFNSALEAIARDDSRSAELRLAALDAIPGGLKKVDAEVLGFLIASLDPAQSAPVRSEAATLLGRARLADNQLDELAAKVGTAGPLEMTRLLAAYEHSTSEEVGLKLVNTLKASKGLTSLRPDLLKTVLAKYPVSVQEQSKALLDILNQDAAKQSAHLDDLMTSVKDGDIRRGQAIFNSPKAACSTCHSMGYAGGHVGPDLTSIGQSRTERDLLESIVYPSASFVRSYEPLIVKTKADEEFSGVVKKDASDEIVLATGPTTEARIPRGDIIEMRPGTVSVMPAGMDQQLSRQELVDLVAFLKGTKWGPR